MSIGVDGRWEAGIGDPTVVGWITVVAYGVSAALSLRCARRTAIGLEHWFWVGAAVALILLGFNKQLDLQTLVTQIGRDMAMRGGWYGERRVAQAAFVSALAVAGLVALVWLLWLVRRLPRATQAAGVGLVLLVVFIVIRGASFHHIDQMVGSSFEGIRFNWILELTPLLLIGIAAFQRRASLAPAGLPPRHRRRRRHRSSRSSGERSSRRESGG